MTKPFQVQVIHVIIKHYINKISLNLQNSDPTVKCQQLSTIICKDNAYQKVLHLAYQLLRLAVTTYFGYPSQGCSSIFQHLKNVKEKYISHHTFIVISKMYYKCLFN